MKYLVWLIVLVLAYGWWRSQRRTNSVHPTQTSSARRPPIHPQEMVACAHCGLHLPRTEALLTDQRYYCCTDHRHKNAS